MQSVTVITLITVIFSFQNARPPFESASVGSDDFDSICLRKTRCFFKAIFARAEHHCARSVVICISSDLLGPLFAFLRRKILTIRSAISSSLKDKTSASVGLQMVNCCSFGWEFFHSIILLTCVLLLHKGSVVAHRLIVTWVI